MAASVYKVLATAAKKLVESGVADWFLISKKEDLTTISGVGADGVTISVDHVFATGAGWVKVICAPATQEVGFSYIGEIGSLKAIGKLDAFIHGSESELHQLMALVKNEENIILVPDGNCDPANPRFYQLGSDCTPVRLLAGEGWKSGKTKDGRKGYKVEFEAPSKNVTIYTGAVVMHP